jgi:hypothetical protein
MDFEGALSILRSDAGGAIMCIAITWVSIRLALLLFWFFVLDLIDLAWSKVNANHCIDLHTGKASGKCHCNRCGYIRDCPYYEKLTFRKRWQLFRAKKDKPY